MNIEFTSWSSNPLAYCTKFYVKENGQYVELTNIKIPESYTEITSEMIRNFGGLKTIDITSNIKSIRANSFETLDNLESVYYHGSPW